MSKDLGAVISKHDSEHGTLKSYVTGFALSIVLTVTAYLLVKNHGYVNRDKIIAAIVGLALTQFVVQLIFFLHLGKETKPRWKLFIFGFMVLVVLILVFGSLWIMDNLNYRMTPGQINTYMNNQGGGF
ncbi:MAG TPA: cytochrome o ubiquinol oxidase subunit IV [Candidatus Saccharimonadales bacterium]|jgi:cytochrome o ubiquinol oxidase operon protein cyoD|nr:cytochrome o ubiquinol oxidase subunit IV [Candidatus Saccharimonadales bacterium]